MEKQALITLIRKIVEEATIMKNKHINVKDIPVNYACIFSHSDEEYRDLVASSSKLGLLREETPTGFLFHIRPLATVSGTLRLLKIRIPDKTRTEHGDADFTVRNYPALKKKYQNQRGWKLIKKAEDFEMLEIIDKAFKVRVYFSNPPLDDQLGIK